MNDLPVFFHMIRRDLISFKREFKSKMIDTLCLFFTNVMAFGYLMPQEGTSSGYAAFFVVGAIASFGFVEIVGKVGILLADFSGEKTINHNLVMPIRSKWIFNYIGCSWALTALIMSIILFPIGKIFVFAEWHWGAVSFWKLIPMMITSNLFFGFFALWLTGILKDMTSLNGLWLRYIAPMWMFGGYVYSWQSAYNLSHLVGYISLINPMLYVMEGMRAAALGQEGYLNYWLCLGVLWVFIVACGWHAKRRLKRKLDCI